ncbi:MAG: hypothetical protein GPJ51_00170 [Candidatus Heimdallarchaeota archaeon]|nr:hypothetical protein [Candidatus Heimdallarchaeota archaeon]
MTSSRITKDDVAKMVKAKNIEGLINLLAYTEDNDIVEVAAFALLDLSKDSHEVLVQFIKNTSHSKTLKHNEEFMLGKTLAILGAMGDREDIVILLDLFDHENLNIKKKAKEVFFEFGNTTSDMLEILTRDITKESLISLLNRFQDTYFGKERINPILLKLNEKNIEHLVSIMNEYLKEKEKTRWYSILMIAEVLVEKKDVRAIEPLMQIGEKTDNYYEWHIHDSLMQIGKFYPEKVIEGYKRANLDYKGDLARVLSKINDERVVQLILNAFQETNIKIKDHDASEYFLRALWNLNLREDAVFPLLSFAYVRFEFDKIIPYILRIGKSAIPKLKEALNSEDEVIKDAAIWVIQSGDELLPASLIIDAIDLEENWNERFHLIEAINYEKLNDENIINRLIPKLLSILQEQEFFSTFGDYTLITSIIVNLEVSSSAIPTLLPLLEIEDFVIREYTMRMLLKVKNDDTALEHIFPLYSDNIGRNLFLNKLLQRGRGFSNDSLNFLQNRLYNGSEQEKRAALLVLVKLEAPGSDVIKEFLRKNPLEEYNYITIDEKNENNFIDNLCKKLDKTSDDKIKSELLNEILYWSHYSYNESIVYFLEELDKTDEIWIVQPLLNELKRQSIYWLDEDSAFVLLIELLLKFNNKEISNSIVIASFTYVQNHETTGRGDLQYLNEWLGTVLSRLKNTEVFHSIETILSFCMRLNVGFFVGAYVGFLKYIKGEQTLELLRKMLFSRVMFGESAAAYLLGEIGDKRHIADLRHIITAPEYSQDVRAACIWSLGEIGDAEDVVLLKNFVENRNAEFKEEAEEALNKIALNLNSYLEKLSSRSTKIRLEGANELRKLGYEHSKNPLYEHILKEEDKEVANTIALTLGELGDKRSIKYLIDMLQIKDTKFREDAVRLLGKLEAKEALEPLCKLIQEEDYEERYFAINTLKLLGERIAIKPIISSLSDKNENVRLRAIKALDNFGGKDVVDAFVRKLNDEDHFVRLFATIALGKHGGNDAIEPLLQMLEDENYNVRYIAIQTLEKLGHEVGNKEDILGNYEFDDYFDHDQEFYERW